MEETIQRVIKNGFRYYQIKQDGEVVGVYPSVTSILGETADKKWLERWENRIGVDNAKEISKNATERGSVMHRLCEVYLNLPDDMMPADRLTETLALSKLDDEIEKFDNRAKIVGGMMFFNYIRSGFFNQIKKVLMQERFLWSKRGGGYAGTVDNVSQLLDSSNCVIDFKTAKKPKIEKFIDDYKHQVAAYAVAVFDRTGIKVSSARIWISNEVTMEPQEFIMGPSDLKEYYGKFIDRLGQFYEKYPQEELK